MTFASVSKQSKGNLMEMRILKSFSKLCLLKTIIIILMLDYVNSIVWPFNKITVIRQSKV